MKKLTPEDQELFISCVCELKEKTSFEHLKKYKHHHHTSTYHHSIAVAYFSFKISRMLGLKADPKTLIYGALLHDYFLYDCHTGSTPFHVFKHPEVSLENARRDWQINEIEANIIKRHMFPLTLIPPKYKESLLVSLVDKGCAVYEALTSRPYEKNIVKMC